MRNYQIAQAKATLRPTQEPGEHGLQHDIDARGRFVEDDEPPRVAWPRGVRATKGRQRPSQHHALALAAAQPVRVRLEHRLWQRQFIQKFRRQSITLIGRQARIENSIGLDDRFADAARRVEYQVGVLIYHLNRTPKPRTLDRSKTSGVEPAIARGNLHSAARRRRHGDEYACERRLALAARPHDTQSLAAANG